MTERRLATIRRIAEVKPIEGADKIEAVRVDGWWVVAQKGEYPVGNLAVYLEVDSWVPTTLAPFLTKAGHFPKEYGGVQGERLRTIRLKGQLSQGLLLPISGFDKYFEGAGEMLFNEGDDVTNVLGILKWEKAIPANLAGTVKGNFPSFIPKTNEERIQNLSRELEQWKAEGDTWEVTEKLDGSSMTVYVRHGMDDEAGPTVSSGVCSRNLELKPDENNTFWSIAVKKQLIDKLMESGYSYALQGELIGPGIQGNPYGLSEPEFYCYKIWDIDNQRYLSPGVRRWFCHMYEIKQVPVVGVDIRLKPHEGIPELLLFAEGVSDLNHQAQREGWVFKSNKVENRSFKVISNAWLLKNE